MTNDEWSRGPAGPLVIGASPIRSSIAACGMVPAEQAAMTVRRAASGFTAARDRHFLLHRPPDHPCASDRLLVGHANGDLADRLVRNPLGDHHLAGLGLLLGDTTAAGDLHLLLLHHRLADGHLDLH